jgi:hypothetical protein
LRAAGLGCVGEGKGEVGALAPRALRSLRTSETLSVVPPLVHAQNVHRVPL